MLKHLSSRKNTAPIRLTARRCTSDDFPPDFVVDSDRVECSGEEKETEHVPKTLPADLKASINSILNESRKLKPIIKTELKDLKNPENDSEKLKSLDNIEILSQHEIDVDNVSLSKVQRSQTCKASTFDRPKNKSVTDLRNSLPKRSISHRQPRKQTLLSKIEREKPEETDILRSDKKDTSKL